MSTPLKLPLTLSILVLAAVAFASPAMARDGHHGNNGNHNGHYDRRDDRGHSRDDKYRRGHDRTVYVPGWRRPAYRVPPPRRYYRHAPTVRIDYRAPAPRWTRGARYYGPGYGPTYVVNDYGYYGLRAPPRGYYWRRDDRGEFLLVAIATGIITDLILHGGY